MRRLELLDRVAEIQYRVRPRQVSRALTWPVAETERARLTLTWPSTYDWPLAHPMLETIKDALGRLCRLRLARTPQPFRHVVMLDGSLDGRRSFKVAIDYNDLPVIHEQALAECGLYVKLQHSRDGYDDPRIVPGGYPTTRLGFYKYCAPFRERSGRLGSIDVLARFGFDAGGDLRRKAVSLLGGMEGVRLAGDTGSKVRYSRFLREAASARMALELPGNGCFTHRTAEFLGLGTAMLAIRPSNVLHVPLQPGIHYVEVAPDLSDLVSQCRYYLEHDAERERIATAGAEFFERYLHCDQLGAYYVRLILDRLS